MALWVTGQIYGRDHARAVRRYIQYDPAPPYLADEPLRRHSTPGTRAGAV